MKPSEIPSLFGDDKSTAAFRTSPGMTVNSNVTSFQHSREVIEQRIELAFQNGRPISADQADVAITSGSKTVYVKAPSYNGDLSPQNAVLLGIVIMPTLDANNFPTAKSSVTITPMDGSTRVAVPANSTTASLSCKIVPTDDLTPAYVWYPWERGVTGLADVREQFNVSAIQLGTSQSIYYRPATIIPTDIDSDVGATKPDTSVPEILNYQMGWSGVKIEFASATNLTWMILPIWAGDVKNTALYL